MIESKYIRKRIKSLLEEEWPDLSQLGLTGSEHERLIFLIENKRTFSVGEISQVYLKLLKKGLMERLSKKESANTESLSLSRARWIARQYHLLSEVEISAQNRSHN
ncbi:MAG: hypothetical protein MRY72_12435 [Aquisalinus sp.]|nr:hypothetical protein [Aquisalinus sp.]